MPRQKLWVYADESGQDSTSAFFVVVAVAGDQDQDHLRDLLLRVERLAGTSGLKWHKTHGTRRIKYLEGVLSQKIGQGTLYFGVYPKPIPYFFPLLDVVEYAIRRRAHVPYVARVHVDGIDRKKAAELTNALRQHGITLESVRSRRDESEPLIRLADMWAGCIRAARRDRTVEQALLARAQRSGYLTEVANKNPLDIKGMME